MKQRAQTHHVPAGGTKSHALNSSPVLPLLTDGHDNAVVTATSDFTFTGGRQLQVRFSLIKRLDCTYNCMQNKNVIKKHKHFVDTFETWDPTDGFSLNALDFYTWPHNKAGLWQHKASWHNALFMVIVFNFQVQISLICHIIPNVNNNIPNKHNQGNIGFVLGIVLRKPRQTSVFYMLLLTTPRKETAVCVCLCRCVVLLLLLTFEFTFMKIRRWISEAYLGSHHWSKVSEISGIPSPCCLEILLLSRDDELKDMKSPWGHAALILVLLEAFQKPHGRQVPCPRGTGSMHTFYCPADLGLRPGLTGLPVSTVSLPSPWGGGSKLYNYCLSIIFVLFSPVQKLY